MNVRLAVQRAIQFHSDGRLAAAVDAYRAILKQHPETCACWSNLGVALRALGRKDEGLEALSEGVGVCPQVPELNYNLGNALKEAGDREGALKHYRAAWTLEPGNLEAARACGTMLMRLERFDEAVEHYGAALGRHPDDSKLCAGLGLALWWLRRPAAAAALRRAVALDPASSDLRRHLHDVLRWLGNDEEDEEQLRAGLAREAGSPLLLAVLGQSLIGQGRLDEGLACCRAVLKVDPDHQEARLARGRANFLAGRYAVAWPDRYRQVMGLDRRPKGTSGREWERQDIAGQSILLYGEQGLGDVIQNARYAPLVAGRGARVVVACRRRLVGLLRRIRGIDEVVPDDRPPPRTDWHCSLLDVPAVWEHDVDSIPAACPYLPPRVRQTPVLPPARQLRVAIVWAGNPTQKQNRRRSCRLEDFAPLLELPGTEFVSFQIGPPTRELSAGWRGLVHDPGDALNGLEATADALMEVDLVITVDTMLAHLAGALGRPVWNLLAFAPDMRWMLDRTDTPWYPTMRLFRQPKPNDWAGVFREVRRELEAHLARAAGLAGVRDRQSVARSPQAEIADKRAFQLDVSPDVRHAIQLHADGKLAEAVESYRTILERHPETCACWSNLGVALRTLGRKDESLQVLRKGTRICPRVVELNYNLGNALAETAEYEEALKSYRTALNQDPAHRKAAYSCGAMLLKLKRYEQAADHYRAVLQQHTDDAKLYDGLGRALSKLRHLPAAVVAYRRAIALDPALSVCRISLHGALSALGRYTEDERQLRAVAAQDERSPAVLAVLGQSLIDQGRLEAGLEYCDAAVAVKPDHVDARLGRARANFLAGRYAAALPDFRWRRHHPAWRAKEVAGRNWEGQDVAGQSILLYGEQGLGDVIQYARFAPLVAARGALVSLYCKPRLVGLLRRIPTVDDVVPSDRPQPPTDWTCSLVDVLAVLGTNINSIPADCPYVPPRRRTPPVLPQAHRFRVGIVWGGNPAQQRDRLRSCRLEDFAPLFELPSAAFVSFQVGPHARELGAGWRGLVHDPGDALATLEATADALMEVDLVITVDTMLAHLAGALGRPVWTLLAFAHDWRWMLGRADTPWYPTMRLFRQPKPNDWAGVFCEVRRELEARLARVGGRARRRHQC